MITRISLFEPNSLIQIVVLSIVGLCLGIDINYNMILRNVLKEHVTAVNSALNLTRGIFVSVTSAVYAAFINADESAYGYMHFYMENALGFKIA